MLASASRVWRRLRTDDMLRHGVMLTFFMLLADLFGYLYQLFLGRFLTVEEYGTLFSITSLFTIIFLVSSEFLQTSVAKFTSKFKAENALGKVNYLYHYSMKRTLLFGIALLVILTLLTPVISHFLRIDNKWYLLILILSLPLAFAVPIICGILQGLQRFLSLGLTNVLLAFIKLGVAILLVWLFDFGVFGGLVCIPIAYAIAFLVALFLVRNLATMNNENFQPKGLFSYTGLTLVAFFAFITMTHVDVVLAKHFLSAEDTGNYSAISVLGRVVLYAPMGVAVAMFPKTSQLFESKIPHSSTLVKAIILTLIICGVVVMLYGFFPEDIIGVIFQGKYSLAASHLLEYGLAMALFALSFLLMNYSLSINQTKVAYLLLGGMILECTLVGLFNSDIGQIVNMVLLSAIVCFVAVAAFCAKIRKSGAEGMELGLINKDESRREKGQGNGNAEVSTR